MEIKNVYHFKDFIIKYGLFLTIITLINIFVFSNFSVCVGSKWDEKEIDLSEATGENIVYTDGKLQIDVDGGWVEFHNVEIESKTITLVFIDEDDRIVTGSVACTDESRQYDFETLTQFRFNQRYNIVQKSFDSGGKIKSLKVEIGNSSYGICLDKVVINQHQKFRFNFVSWIIMLVIGIVCRRIKEFHQFLETLNYHDKRQRVAIAITKGLCIAFAFLIVFCTKEDNAKLFISYNSETGPSERFVYTALFDAFQHGTAKFMYNVDPALEELENVYDRSERDRANVSYVWDTAYYKGRYYCYFGVLPVMVIYEIMYLLTGHLPGVAVLMFMFLALGIFFLFGATRKTLEYFKITPSLYNYLICHFAIVFASFYYIIASNPDHYTITIICAITCLLGCIYFAYGAVKEERKAYRIIQYILSAIFFVGIAASRPAMIILALAFILPPFLRILFSKQLLIKGKVIDALSFAIPVMLGAGILMFYNYIRFESPMEFGAKYQLTVGDIRYNSFVLNFNNIMGALYHYFFRSIKFSTVFPFVNCNDNIATITFGKSYYTEASIGVFCIPFNILTIGLFLQNYNKERKMELNTYISIIVATIFLAIFDFSMGGVVGRYIGDFAIGITFLAFMFVMKVDMQGGLKNKKWQRGVDFIIVVSVILGMLLLFSNDTMKLCMFHRSPNLVLFLENIFDI